MSKSECASQHSNTAALPEAYDARVLFLITVLLTVVTATFYLPDLMKNMNLMVTTKADRERDKLVLETTIHQTLRLTVYSDQGVALPRPKPSQTQFFFQPVPINFADKNLLTSASGVGPVLAERILNYRRVHGYLDDYQRLMEIQGVGPKKLLNLKNAFSYETEW